MRTVTRCWNPACSTPCSTYTDGSVRYRGGAVGAQTEDLQAKLALLKQPHHADGDETLEPRVFHAMLDSH